MKARIISLASILPWSQFAVLCLAEPQKLDYVGWKTVDSVANQLESVYDVPANTVPHEPIFDSNHYGGNVPKASLFLGEMFPLQDRSDSGEERIFESFKNVTGNLENAVLLFTDAQGALGFLFNVSVAYVLVQAWWIFAHFLFWDYSKTLPSEEFSMAALVGFLKNTDAALFYQMAIWGTSLTASILFLLPPLLLNVFPSLAEALSVLGKRKKRSSRKRRSLPLFTEADIKVAIRKTLCPLCLARLIVFNTLVFLSSVVIWNITPFLRNDGSSTLNTSNVVRRKREFSPSVFNRDEEVKQWEMTLLRSLSKFPEI